MKKQHILFACLVYFICSSLFADKVILKSGSFMTGKVSNLTSDKLVFNSDDLGEVSIPVDKIVSLEASSVEHTLQYHDNSTEKKMLTVSNGAVVVDDAGNFANLDISTIKAIDPVEETWHGSINASATATRGNTIGESASIIGDLSHRWEKDRLTANAGYYYASSGDSKETKQRTVSRFEVTGQEDHFWSTKCYTYVKTKYEFDRIMKLKYRYRFGAGLGYQWFENKDFGYGKSSFNQELGMSYILEKYDHNPEDDYGTFRYAHHYIWEIAKVEGLAFAHNFEFLPQADEWTENYLIFTDVGITYAFRANWQLIAKAEWDYKKRVAEGTKHSDIRYILGIGYKW